MREHHWTQKWLWSFPSHFRTKSCLPFANKKYSSISHCQRGHKTSAFRRVLLMPWLDPSSSFYAVSATVLPAMVNETAQVGSSLFWQLNHIVLAIAKSAGWSAFKILSLNHSPWHTCTDISGKLWFGTCVLLVVFFSTRDRKSNLHYPLTQQVQALMLWAELRLLLRKMVPASSPDIPVTFLGPA